MLHKKIFNLIINNIDFDKLRLKKKTQFNIWINDITIEVKDNIINIWLNWIGTCWLYEKGNYCDYIIKVWNLIDTAINFYLCDWTTRHRTDEEVLEFRND